MTILHFPSWAMGLALAASLSTSIFPAHAAETLKPVDLRCEYLANPLGIDVTQPRLMWRLETAQPGARDLREANCQILVASTAEALAKDQGDLWDSGKVTRGAVPQLAYAGKPLNSRQPCFWKVRVWDQAGNPSAWSTPAQWTMGLLSEEDWGGKWIGTTDQRHIRQPAAASANGYHSEESAAFDAPKWIQVDLGKSREIDKILLVPARPTNYPDTPGFGFPVRFKVEVSDVPDFSASEVVMDESGADYPNPAETTVVIPATGTTARYVRVTATHLWARNDGVHLFSLRRLEVLSGGVNIAANVPVTSLDSIERTDWNRASLTAATSTDDDLNDAAPLLRKEFALPERKIVSATATSSGLGYQILYVNGQRVGTNQLDPGWTEYHKRCLYVTYDVTSLLQAGTNAVGVMLGNGFYNPTTPDVWAGHVAPWTAPVTLRFNLHIVFADGTSETVVSDDTWKWAFGEVVYQNIRSGETQDKRRTMEGWSKPGFAAAEWKPAMVMQAPKGQLTAQMHPPIRTDGEVPVAEITEPKPGIYVCKMAENMSGWARFRASGKPGLKITLRHAETLLPDGTINADLSGFTYGRWQTDAMILGDSGSGVLEPHFAYHGFQYIQIEGLEKAPAKEDLVGVKVHTGLDEAGSFSSSDQMINDIQAMFRRTYLNNLHGIPTDCPQREKLGWMCDGFMASEMGMWNFDAAAIYTKWSRDMRDDQESDGRLSAIIPGTGWGKEPTAAIMDPLWCGVIVYMPWHLYQMYGDTRVLEMQYEAMQRYVDYVSKNTVGDLLDAPKFNILGDWLEVDFVTADSKRTPKLLAANSAWFQCVDTLSKSAQVLGKEDDAKKYADHAERIRVAINKEWLDATGKYAADSQCGPAQALALGIAPDAKRPEILAGLLENIKQREGHVSTGIVGTYYLFKALEKEGQDAVAWDMATQTTYPSWGHLLSIGATTMYENWRGQCSYSHPALASPGFWLYEGVAGIRRAGPGFSKVVIKPGVSEKLEWAKATYRAPAGEIKSQWKRQNNQFTLEVSIPPSVTAEVFVPSRKGGAVMEGGKPVQPVRAVSGYAVFAIGSGDYNFQSEVSSGAKTGANIPPVGAIN